MGWTYCNRFQTSIVNVATVYYNSQPFYFLQINSFFKKLIDKLSEKVSIEYEQIQTYYTVQRTSTRISFGILRADSMSVWEVR